MVSLLNGDEGASRLRAVIPMCPTLKKLFLIRGNRTSVLGPMTTYVEQIMGLANTFNLCFMGNSFRMWMSTGWR